MITNVAYAHFRSGSFGRGVELIDAIAEASETADHHPEIDLRLEGVTVRLTTYTDEHFLWLSQRDVELARRISEAARSLGPPIPRRLDGPDHFRRARPSRCDGPRPKGILIRSPR